MSFVQQTFTTDTSKVEENRELNFMGAKNFKLHALLRLYVVWTSGIIGEPQYYRDGNLAPSTLRIFLELDLEHQKKLMFETTPTQKSSDVFMSALRDALDADYEKTLTFATILRNEFGMRLGPQVILVEAAMHQKRQEYNKSNPNVFRNVAKQIIIIPTDVKSQMDYFIKVTGGKAKLPNILKKCWKDALERFSKYQFAKYVNTAKIVDLVRLSHPRSDKNAVIKEVTETGTVLVEDDESTWEKMRSAGKSWKEIFNTLGKKFPHMALLRNLRGMSTELEKEDMLKVMDQLVRGVPNGKQFPFRYYTAYQQIESGQSGQSGQITSANPGRFTHQRKASTTGYKPGNGDEGWKWKAWRKSKTKNETKETSQTTEQIVQKVIEPATPAELKQLILDGLEKCMREAIKNFPSLKGRVVSLSDNSGSARGAFTSEYGSQSVATIGNLSALITAMSAELGGQVGVFGDKLEMYEVSKTKGVIEQLKELEKLGQTIGGCTENGIWLWFKNAHTNNDINTNHLFIYSDMQAGHGGLFGTNKNDYIDFTCRGNYIDVIKLIERHRSKINDKLNVFSVQTAGYDNSLIPEAMHRTCILAGWTGNEVKYANEMINIWNNM